ncbi:Hypothetical predicted protein, partial [Pelobates cultripes]
CDHILQSATLSYTQRTMVPSICSSHRLVPVQVNYDCIEGRPSYIQFKYDDRATDFVLEGYLIGL